MTLTLPPFVTSIPPLEFIMILSESLQKRLDDLWSRLQQLEHSPNQSQIELDEACVARLEQVIGYLEAKASRNNR